MSIFELIEIVRLPHVIKETCEMTKIKVPLVKYQCGDPPCDGVYACRIHPIAYSSDTGWVEKTDVVTDIFLIWDGENWRYSSTDGKFDSHRSVLGWVGPLQR